MENREENSLLPQLKKESARSGGGEAKNFRDFSMDVDAETLEMIQEIVRLYGEFDEDDPASVEQAANRGNYLAMFDCGKHLISGDNPADPKATEWFRKASACPNKAIAACTRIYEGISLFFQDGKQKESREILTQTVADPVFEIPAFRQGFGGYLNNGRYVLAYMLFNGRGGYANIEEALRLAQEALADGDKNPKMQSLAAEAKEALRRREKRKKQERVRKGVRIRGGHAGIMLLRLAEIAAMAAFVPLAQKIFNLGGSTGDLLAAAHYAVLGFLILSIPWLLYFLLGRDDPEDLIGWLFWGVLIAAACTYGIFRLERWSVVRAHYYAYTVALTALGAGLIVFFLYKAVRHLAGIFTGK